MYNEPTYYYHQRHLLIPSVVYFWRKYQKKILDSLKGKEVVLAGDGRHDSMAIQLSMAPTPSIAALWALSFMLF